MLLHDDVSVAATTSRCETTAAAAAGQLHGAIKRRRQWRDDNRRLDIRATDEVRFRYSTRASSAAAAAAATATSELVSALVRVARRSIDPYLYTRT